jgi:hypothetical protein
MASDSKAILESQPHAPPIAGDGSAVEVVRFPVEDSIAMEELQTRPAWMARLDRIWESRRTPAFLVSLILHTAIFLILAMWSVLDQVGKPDGFDFSAVIASELTDNAATELMLASQDAPPPPAPAQDVSPEPPLAASTSSDVQLSQLLAADQPQADSLGLTQPSTATNPMEQLLKASGTSMIATFVASGVDSRQPELRRKVAMERGGTLESEQAVEAALDWIAAHQTPSGAWSLVHDTGVCNGRCRDTGSKDRFDTAATGLSLLAFLGAGYTHQDGKHRETVKRGIYFLLQVLEETPQGGSFLYQSEIGMYNHGIATFALCEAYQLTGDKDLEKAAQQAIDFTVNAQNYQGGWGYLPQKPGDLTISSWQVMALKSAASSGLEIPPATVFKIDRFVESQKNKSSFSYRYRDAPGVSPTCTAIGMLMRLFRGISHTDPDILEGAAFLHQKGPSASDIYFDYYATLALFHIGGPLWERWHPQVREHLINSQSGQGHEAGSWYFQDVHGKEGGRLYTTAMAAMTLEVYYRFSPLYQNADIPFEL